MCPVKGHYSVNHTRHMAVVTATARRICCVLCVPDQLRGVTKLRMAGKTWCVATIQFADLTLGIAAVHRVATKTVDLFSGLALRKTFRS